jgi:predicted 2-oxoglutarate/Fe(II)-dependent dioxygenase YbiX
MIVQAEPDMKQRLSFLSDSVLAVRDFISHEECRTLIEEIVASPSEQSHVVRAGESIVDQSLRNCLDHHVSQATSQRVARRLLVSFARIAERLGTDADALYGPYFVSYAAGSYFRCHRDVANHPDDPIRLASHRWSLVLYLNGRQEPSSLPTFDGGSLIVYSPRISGRDRRVVVTPEPGMLVLFRSHLMHEVSSIRAGIRYAATGWMARPDDSIMKELV